jgi:hypothetical protein
MPNLAVTHAMLSCHVSGLNGHLASYCHHTDIGNNYKGRCQVVLSAFGHPPSYPIDTGATDHLTNQVDMLTAREPYHGHDKVYTTNRVGMHISHVVMLVRNLFLLISLSNYTSQMFFKFPLSHVIFCPFVSSPVTTMSLSNFTPLMFLLKIVKLGTFSLVVMAIMVYTNLMCHLLTRSLVVFVFRRLSGTLALFIWRFPLFAMFSIAMRSLSSLVVKVIQFVMHVNKARVISFLFLS